MKQIRFKHLATLGVCCSLFSNSLAGVTAVAETMTIESSPTAASHEQTASTKESAETEVKETQTTETSEAPTKESQEEQENGAVEVKKEEQSKEEVVEDGKKEAEETQESETAPVLTQPMPLSGIGTKAGNMDTYYQQIETVRASILNNKSAISQAFPGARIGFKIKSLDGINLDIADFDLDVTMKLGRETNGTWTWGADSAVPTEKAINSLDVLTPSKTLSVAVRPSTVISDAIMYFMREPQLTVPKYVESVEFVDNPQLITLEAAWNGLTKPREMDFLKTSKVNDTLYKLSAPWPSAYGGIKPQLFNYTTIGIVYTSMSNYATSFGAMFPNKDFTLGITNRKVTESFKNPAGAIIPPPPNFEEGRKTSITNNDFTYTQSGTLPKSYKGTDGKTYVLKGWYKGKTKPDTLSTGTPAYKVTYDDNDDLNVVYEEVKTKAYTLPSKEISFGYVGEKGELVNPADFTIEAELGESDETETTVLSKIHATDDASNMLKKLAIPGKSYTIPEGGIKTYGTRYVNHTIPKYYKTMSITPTATYTGDKTKYPVADEVRKTIDVPNDIASTVSGTTSYRLTTNGIVFGTRRLAWAWDSNKTAYAMGIYSGVVGNNYNLATPDKTIYYYLENRRVTENFVDNTGTKITPPTGFTQGKQTVIDSSTYTFKQSGTLPDSYKVGTKTYKFKGWYKGTDKTKIQTTKAPSYAVTFDDKDDLNVVYEVDTTKDYNFPSKTVNFQFVNEAGTIISPTPFTITTDLQQEINSTYTKLGSITGANSGNTKQVTIPAKTIRADVSLGGVNSYGTTNTRITIPKFYENISVYTGSAYTQATLNRYSTADNTLIGNPASNAPLYYGLNKMTATQFKVNEFDTTTTIPEQSKYLYNRLYVSSAPNLFNSYYTPVGTIYYQLTNRKVTENFVDASGAKLPSAPTGFTQGNQIPMTSNTFKYTSAKALPASYSAGGKTYVFQGWYKGKTKPNTLTTSTTPTYNTTFDDNDDLNVVYEEGTASVAASLKGMVTVMPSGGNQMWNMTIKNTGTAPLTDLKITPTANWSKGLANPKQLSVRLGSGPNQLVSVTAESWANGANLGVEVPVGGTLTVSMTTLATGKPMEVLQAEVALSGNMPTTTVSDTVRIEGADQEVTDPVGEGFISLPTFDFGQVGIAGATTQHGLKKAADYYGNGTRNPFVRIKKSQPNWSLTAQLSQPKSAKDSLPTATRLLLGQAAVSKVDNYNLVTEMLNPVGTTPTLSLTANNSVTNVITNKQFTGNDVYNLDFNFNNVKLEVPANQGTKGEQYNATVTWNLVTGP
ncbi:hypothetical protein IGL81_002477 [Enterococcus sp. DIV1318a]|uniref:WxL domain-containing protein n=1 Tax=Enterococcus sp. DIV1318a TaxID=2774984 RepID=UPI003F2602F5